MAKGAYIVDNDHQTIINLLGDEKHPLPEFTREVSTDSSDCSIKSQTTLRDKVHALHKSSEFHIAVLVLVVIDLLFVVTELAIDTDPIKSHDAKFIIFENVLKYGSITILSLFLLENIFSIYVMRGEFFREYLEVFDAVVVVISLTVDIMVVASHDTFSALGFVIVLRLWRIVRVITAVVTTVNDRAERRIRKQKERRRRAEEDLAEHKEMKAKYEAELEFLREIVDKNKYKNTLTPKVHESRRSGNKYIHNIISSTHSIVSSIMNSSHSVAQVK